MKTQQSNAIGWFEVPVTNMERAMKFYETVFGVKLERHQMGPLDMAWFPWTEDGKGAAGSLVYHKEWYQPSSMAGVWSTSPHTPVTCKTNWRASNQPAVKS